MVHNLSRNSVNTTFGKTQAVARKAAPHARRHPIAQAAHAAVWAASGPMVEVLEQRQLLSAAPQATVVVNAGILTVYGTKKADGIVVARNDDGTLHVSLGVAGQAGTDHLITDPVTQIVVLANSGNDVISVSESPTHPLGVPLTIHGGAGNDTISGSAAADQIFGEAGNDTISAGDGDDYIDGGSGNDTISGGGGNDTILGGSGKNTISGGAGSNNIGSGHNTITAQAVPPTYSTARATPLVNFGTVSGLTPTQIRAAYGFGDLNDPNFANRGQGQAVAVIIPYSTPNIQASLETFSGQFNLPAPDASHFQIVNATSTFPPADPDPLHGWEAEACTDVEWIHAIAPEAKIYLVNANSDLFPDIFVGVDKAVDTLVANNGGGVVCITAGSQLGEIPNNTEAALDFSFTRAAAAQGVSFVAGAGDVSDAVSYPAISPYVTAVGGTSLGRDNTGALDGTETAWSMGGGGVSSNYPPPSYQSSLQLTGRGNPDVAYNADPNVGIAMYDKTVFNANGDTGWVPGGVGGTSAGAPQWAALVALANQKRLATGRQYLATNLNSVLYDLGNTYPGQYFNDIATGASGTHAAAQGYDLVTGLGSPNAGPLIDALAVADVKPLAQGLHFSAQYELALAQTGPLSAYGAGFVVGTGNASGGSTVNVNLVPSVQQPDSFQTISIASLNFNPAIKNARTGKFASLGQATVTVTVVTPDLTPITQSGDAQASNNGALIPPIPDPFTQGNPGAGGQAGGNTTSNTGAGSGSAGTVDISGTGTGNTAGAGAGQGNINPGGATPENPFPTTTSTTQTLSLVLSLAGQVYRGKNGQLHIKGTFINLGTNGGEPVEGKEFIFRGKFSD